MDLLTCIETGRLQSSVVEELGPTISITLFQAVLKTLVSQDGDGSWDATGEQTAYGILILCEARRVKPFMDLQGVISSAIERAVEFLQFDRCENARYLWIEKVSYNSPTLMECYRVAALKASSISPASLVGSTSHLSSIEIAKYVAFFKQTPLFSSHMDWQLTASVIEGSLFKPLLIDRRLSTFKRQGMGDDKYFDIIPLTWTLCNNLSRTFASPRFLEEMMVVSLLNYQVDEFMEALAAPRYYGRTHELRYLIDNIMDGSDIDIPSTNGSSKLVPKASATIHCMDGAAENTATIVMHCDASSQSLRPDADTPREISEPLCKFTQHILNHPLVLAASSHDREAVKKELRIFLHAHVTQIEDNALFGQQHDKDVYNYGRDSFYRWVHTTSADHTSCPYSFAFVACMISALFGEGRDCFTTGTEKYFAAAACQHLATMCRMYNDWGSVLRDREEANLNSVNFPEFATSTRSIADKKDSLFLVAEFERGLLNEALSRLNGCSTLLTESRLTDTKRRQMQIWRVFCDVTDLYGQIYVVRDIASRRVLGNAGEGPKNTPVTSME